MNFPGNSREFPGDSPSPEIVLNQPKMFQTLPSLDEVKNVLKVVQNLLGHLVLISVHCTLFEITQNVAFDFLGIFHQFLSY